MHLWLDRTPQVRSSEALLTPDPPAFPAGRELPDPDLHGRNLPHRMLIESLMQHSTPVDCERECVLFRQGDSPEGIYIVRSGEIALTMTSVTGESCLRLTAGPGSVLGLPAVISNKPYSLTVIAQAGSQVVFVSSDRFHPLMAAEPDLSFMVLQLLAAEAHLTRNAFFAS